MKRKKNAVSRKISKLRKEGIPLQKSEAIALSMKRSHRLTPSGGYIRKGRKRHARKT